MALDAWQGYVIPLMPIVVLILGFGWVAYDMWFLQPKERKKKEKKEQEEKDRWEKDLQSLASGEGGGSGFMDQYADDEAVENLRGVTPEYMWTQTKEEVEVRIPVPPETATRQVRFDATGTRIKVEVDGEVRMQGKLHRRILADEAVWQFDEADENDQEHEKATGKVLWVVLPKKAPTEKNSHWKCVVEGDPEIDVAQFGPAVMAADGSDKDEVRRMVQQFKEEQRAREGAKA